jgi:hypothetical protein
MSSACAILLITPLALVIAVRGLVVDRTKWLALGGTVISGGLALLIILRWLGA